MDHFGCSPINILSIFILFKLMGCFLWALLCDALNRERYDKTVFTVSCMFLHVDYEIGSHVVMDTEITIY